MVSQQFRLHADMSFLQVTGIRFFSPLGHTGVNLFVIISGYFIGYHFFNAGDVSGPLPLVFAYCIFVFWGSINEFQNKKINLLASTVFAAYLLNSAQVFPFIVTLINKSNNMIFINLGAIIGAVVTLFIAFLVDKIRQFLFTKLDIQNIIEQVIDSFVERTRRLFKNGK